MISYFHVIDDQNKIVDVLSSRTEVLECYGSHNDWLFVETYGMGDFPMPWTYESGSSLEEAKGFQNILTYGSISQLK